MSNSLLYDLQEVGKEFSGPTEKLEILKNITLSVDRGDSLAILGSSGSGKTTLLHMLGTLDVATRGNILFEGRELTALSELTKARLRNREIGFIFQFHHLLPEFNTVENVALQGLIAGLSRKKAHTMAERALELVGMSHRRKHSVTTLSGGERQRAAVARAILLEPKVLLADEPTGNLDQVTGDMVGKLLLHLNRELGTTLIVVTHNRALAEMMNRRLELRSGELYALAN